MLIKNNNENILNEYIDYLKDKGKITKIKDTSKVINIRFSSGILFYFLSLVSIVLIILTIFLIGNSLINPSPNNESKNVIVIGVALLTVIVIGVTLNEKNAIKFNCTYLNENQIKVNNKIFDIEKEDCYVDIIKNFEYHVEYDSPYRHVNPSNSHELKYFLRIKGNKKLQFEITNGTEEELKDFIYNFEYETSDFKKETNEFMKIANNGLEELYGKGTVSHETLNKLKGYADKNIDK